MLSMTGCGERPPTGFPQTVPFKLIVLNQDTPLSGAAVSMISEASDSEWFAGGTTDANGEAEMTTMQGTYQVPGLPPGHYRVTVTKISGNEDSLLPDRNAGMSAIEYAIRQAEVEKNRKPEPPLFHPKYSHPVDTPLTIEVKAGKREETIRVGQE